MRTSLDTIDRRGGDAATRHAFDLTLKATDDAFGRAQVKGMSRQMCGTDVGPDAVADRTIS